jgi:hypothetical protein
VNVREGHPHDRGLINFLINLLRASALLNTLEFLVFGHIPRVRGQLFWEFYRSDEEVAKYDPAVWSYRKTELLSSMGLFLAPYLFNGDGDVEGTCMITPL